MMTRSMSSGATPDFAIASLRGIRREVDRRDLGAGARARDDAGALLDPLVGGVDRADEVVVRHRVLAAGRADRVDAGVGGSVRLLEGGFRHARLSRVRPVQAACSMSSIAAGRSSGVFTATAGTPLRRALGEADERAGGRDLDDAGDAGRGERLHAAVPAHGRGDLADEQVDEGGAGCHGAAVAVRPEGDAGVGHVVVGGDRREALDGGPHVPRVERAGDLQRDDAGAGGRLGLQLLERVEGAGDDDLAAAVEVRGLEAELVESRERAASSPPSTALMPVGSSAAASAIARPRSATKRIASASARTPAAAAAVISPTEWPAMPPMRSARPSARRRPRVRRPAATMSGWAIAVSRMVSASLTVPWVARSMPAASE